MRRKICVLIAVVFLIFGGFGLIACERGVSGTYKATDDEGAVAGISYAIVLKMSGSCSITKSLSGETVNEYDGTYTVDDNTITFNLQWTDEVSNTAKEGTYSGTILKDGGIKLKFFGKTLTYYKS